MKTLTLIKDSLTEQFEGFLFFDQWEFNPGKFIFDKKVLGFDFIRIRILYSDKVNSIAFRIFLSDELSRDDLLIRLNRVNTVNNWMHETGDRVLIEPYPIEQFYSILFIEDWYLNPKSGHIRKKVNELALIRGYMDAEKYHETGDRKDLEWKKDILFKVMLNE